MEETVFVVYSVDDDYSPNSRQVIAVCDHFNKAFDQCWKYAEQDMTNEDKSIAPDDSYRLGNFNQTQSYAGDGQLMIVEVPVNKLIV